MKKSIILLIILSVVAFATINVKANNLTQNIATTINEQTIERTFTLDELKENNGKNGAKAYIAADGIVYDVTDVKAWTGGKHKSNQAGQDITAIIKKAPHGNSVLKKLTQVGILLEEQE